MPSSPHSIQVAQSDEQIMRCFSVMAELRPHLVADKFLARVRLMQEEGYELAFVEAGGEVKAVTGFRVFDKLATGRTLYVDDLVTTDSARSQGYGDALFDWLFATAKERNCSQLDLDSGVQRFDAHRFYLRKRMKISSHHFAIAVNE
ncbi:hypothetical protein IAD21_03214 [Abditibacteriota bacterium]|nr:hypothetical protein IAD21_03214 [Abditibacteriota bacterium]